MKISKKLTLSFVAPFMILISTIGMILRDDTRKIFYLPIGLMGISIILEKDIRIMQGATKDKINVFLIFIYQLY